MSSLLVSLLSIFNKETLTLMLTYVARIFLMFELSLRSELQEQIEKQNKVTLLVTRTYLQTTYVRTYARIVCFEADSCLCGDVLVSAYNARPFETISSHRVLFTIQSLKTKRTEAHVEMTWSTL